MEETKDTKPQTAGVAPDQTQRPLGILQFTKHTDVVENDEAAVRVVAAAKEIACYHPVKEGQAERYGKLERALVDFLTVIVANTPAGPERSTAISRAREAKFWASAGISLEG